MKVHREVIDVVRRFSGLLIPGFEHSQRPAWPVGLVTVVGGREIVSARLCVFARAHTHRKRSTITF